VIFFMALLRRKQISSPKVSSASLLRLARHNVGNIFALLLVGFFAAAGFIAWDYIWQPAVNPPAVAPKTGKAPDQKKLLKTIEDLDVRLASYKKPASLPPPNPFVIR